MSDPRISVLMPVRNESPYLAEALESIRRQTFQDWEMLVIDDGSTDGSGEILSAAAREDDRIKIILRPAEGLVPALNHGLDLCRGDLVARMDGDDISHPRRLELQEKYLRGRPEVDLVACRVRSFPRAALTEGLLAYETWLNSHLVHDDIQRDFFVESPFPHPGIMTRREILRAAGGYRDLGWPEDYDLWLRLASSGCKFARLPWRLLFWRDRSDRLSRRSSAYSPEAFRNCKIHHLRRDFLSGMAEVSLWGAGIEGKAWRKSLEAAGIGIVRWFEVDPRKVGQTIHGAPVLPLADLKPGMGKLLVTIGVRGARQQVRSWSREKGLVEGKDFLCVT